MRSSAAKAGFVDAAFPTKENQLPTMLKTNFKDLAEILVLAIASEEEDGHICGEFADALGFLAATQLDRLNDRFLYNGFQHQSEAASFTVFAFQNDLAPENFGEPLAQVQT
jgi:hypothetical protein